MTAAERLLRYVQFDTQSNEFSRRPAPPQTSRKIFARSGGGDAGHRHLDAYMDGDGLMSTAPFPAIPASLKLSA